ncbi:rod shape-determining protein MreC [Candidatus Dependentiae bacterium]
MTNASRWKLLKLALVFIVIAFLFKQPKILKKITSVATFPIIFVASKITMPFKKAFRKIKQILTKNSKIASLINENESLIEENVHLRATIDYLERSADLFSFTQRYSQKNLVLSQILLTNFSPEGHYFFIDKGSSSGVTKESCAVFKSHLLGKVEEVFRNHSLVRIITDKKCKVAARISRKNTLCLSTGNTRALEFDVCCVQNTRNLKIGDLVISSGKGMIVPEGFVLGKIIEILPPTSQSISDDWKIKAKPLVDIKNLEFCHIIPYEGLI